MKICKIAGLAFITAGCVSSQEAVNPTEEPTSPLMTTAPTPSKVQDLCVACPNGVTNPDGKTLVYAGVTYTCDASTKEIPFESKSDECTALAANCCPQTVVNPCVVCPGGATYEGSLTVQGETVTCDMVISIARGLESDSSLCAANLAYVEAICCPSPVETPRPTSPPTTGGSTSRPTATVPTPSTVENPIIENPIVESLNVENPKVENPCVACPNGATHEGEFEYERAIFTCAEAISFATGFDSGSDKCTNNVADLEAMCCPPEVVNPCVVCPDGAIFDGEVEEVVIMACVEVISFTMGFELGSDECATNSAYVEAMCCLTKVETVTTTTRIPEIEVEAVISTDATEEEVGSSTAATAIQAIDGGAATAANLGEISTSTATTAIPEIDGENATSAAASAVETSASATTTGTDDTAAATVEDTGASMNDAAIPKNIDAASGCVTLSGLCGFAFVSIAWVVYAV